MVTKSDLITLKASVEAQSTFNRAPFKKWWKPLGNEGEYIVRILPPISKSGVWYLKTAQYHFDQRFFYAPYIIGQPDPIFDYYRNSFRTGSESQIRLAHNLRPKTQYLCNIVVREQHGRIFSEPEEAFIFSMGQKLFDLVMAYFWNSSFGDITDVYRGFDVRIVKKQQCGVPDYSQTVVEPQSSLLARDDQTLHEILQRRHRLESSIVYYEPRALQSALDEYLQTVIPLSV